METNFVDLVARYQHLQSWQNSSSDLIQVRSRASIAANPGRLAIVFCRP
jgi:hypothetical protein